ncbi:unnamed protein product [Paramecium pentaurelia]|uniref:Rab-GAP TBC domain-containing protein n=1 Tax=Paramecium pentaurelia TaxID=43138 RepID=A0A8S1WMA3_9CILI|nr:unnamed protein product [Paramecium pentaurelia]
MRSTQLTQCIQKEEEDQFVYEFDNLSEPQQNLQTPDFQATKQNEANQQVSYSAQIQQTDQYGFKSQINLIHHKDRKTLNARVEKWRQMINEFDKQNAQLIKERTRKGIPDGLRILAWPLLADIKKAKEKSNTIQKMSKYSDFLTKNEFKFEHQIRLDVHRTFPDNINFQDQTVLSESLVNVLKALSEAIPDMGYCQGLNFLTAALIMVTNDENAFWILYRLMTHYNLTAKYKDPNSLYREFYILDNLIQQYHPYTSKILKRHNIDLFYFTTEWFITLFSTALPINLFYRVFEIFLVEGEKTIFRCALAIIHFKEQKLTQLNDFENGLQYLRSNEDLFHLDSNQFINLMLTKYKFSKNIIQQLDQKYKKNQK